MYTKPTYKYSYTDTCLYCGTNLKNKYNFYCNNNCQNSYYYLLYINRWRLGLESGIKGTSGVSNHIRRYLFQKFGSSCQRCRWCEINPTTNKVPLTIHHIDGNCINNKEDNIELLCPNCHSLTDTYGSLNKCTTIKRKSSYR